MSGGQKMDPNKGTRALYGTHVGPACVCVCACTRVCVTVLPSNFTAFISDLCSVPF